MIAYVPADIRIEYFPNTSVEECCYSILSYIAVYICKWELINDHYYLISTYKQIIFEAFYTSDILGSKKIRISKN
jgi:hypothetical protein